MASGESEGDHVLLAIAAPLAEFLDTLSKSVEEFDVVDHAGLLLLPDQKHHEQISCLCSLVSVLFLHAEKHGYQVLGVWTEGNGIMSPKPSS
jgi:hypothetical protein